MLVLTVRVGESIIISDNIKVTVNSVQGTQVRIGVQAPRSISVDREEVYIKKKTNPGKKPEVQPDPPMPKINTGRRIISLRDKK